MHDLKRILLERLSGGLRRKSITDPGKWACAHRILGSPIPGAWTFKYLPWLEEMHKSKSEFNIGQKAAQLGFTETMLNIIFYKIDVEQVDCLYILPAKTPDAGDFSAARFDPALELSPHLSGLFSDVKNIGHKRAGTTNLYIRGSKSRAGLKSVPVGCIIMDEVDEFNQDNIELALERVSGQRTRLIWMISNPTIPLKGINKYYENSTKESYNFKCPSCSRFTNLTFPESIEITAESLNDESINSTYIKCKLCHSKLPFESKTEYLKSEYSGGSGVWVPESKSPARGFYINQLYSTLRPPVELATAYIKSLYDPSDEQTFYNNKLGITHIVEGAQITDYQIQSVKKPYLNGELRPNNALITMGIDVGKYIHYNVDQWFLPNTHITDINTESRCKTLEVGKVQDFDALDLLMYKYRVTSAVIDAHPERRKAFEFSQRFNGHVKMCFYGVGISGKQIHETKINTTEYEPTITVNRTSWLDLSLGRFRNQTIEIPSNVPHEYEQHLKSLVRMYEKDKDGNPYGKYVKSSEDHYAHARNYSEISLPFAAYILNPHSIKSPI